MFMRPQEDSSVPLLLLFCGLAALICGDTFGSCLAAFWIIRSERKSALFERIELASALLVVCAILTEDWDILPSVVHPATKEGLKALGGICVAVFIAMEILFSQFAKRHDGIVRDWHIKRVAEINLETECLRKENNEMAQFLGDRTIGDLESFTLPLKRFPGPWRSSVHLRRLITTASPRS